MRQRDDLWMRNQLGCREIGDERMQLAAIERSERGRVVDDPAAREVDQDTRPSFMSAIRSRLTMPRVASISGTCR